MIRFFSKHQSFTLFFVNLIIFTSFSLFAQNSPQIKDTTIVNPTDVLSNGELLARVGDKEIYLDEYYRRAEFTIRPNYCKGNHNIDKMIILNSLIAEKMIALEYENHPDLLNYKRIDNYIKGRKEQAMRQVLFLNTAWNKVKLSDSEVKKVYRTAGRTYKIKYFTVNSDSAANLVKKEIADNLTFENIYAFMSGNEEIPEREIGYVNDELPQIKKALFSDTLSLHQVLDPIYINDTTYLFVKVDGWNDNVVFSQTGINERVKTVSDNLREEKADQIYSAFIADIMKGKKLSFNNMVLYQLADAIAPLYMSSAKKKRDKFLNNVFEGPNETPEFEKMAEIMDEIQDKPLFKIDDEEWKVKDFNEYMEVHPIVFRKKDIPRREFLLQLRLAIVDLIQDKFLAEEAYKQGLDKDARVQQYTNQFKDANIGLLGKYMYLDDFDIEDKTNMQVVEQYMNPYIRELQQKYNDVIEVNIELFNKIKLTKIDMIATQKNVPFPLLVPSFPQLISNSRLDYGNKMKTKEDK